MQHHVVGRDRVRAAAPDQRGGTGRVVRRAAVALTGEAGVEADVVDAQVPVREHAEGVRVGIEHDLDVADVLDHEVPAVVFVHSRATGDRRPTDRHQGLVRRHVEVEGAPTRAARRRQRRDQLDLRVVRVVAGRAGVRCEDQAPLATPRALLDVDVDPDRADAHRAIVSAEGVRPTRLEDLDVVATGRPRGEVVEVQVGVGIAAAGLDRVVHVPPGLPIARASAAVEGLGVLSGSGGGEQGGAAEEEEGETHGRNSEGWSIPRSYAFRVDLATACESGTKVRAPSTSCTLSSACS